MHNEFWFVGFRFKYFLFTLVLSVLLLLLVFDDDVDDDEEEDGTFVVAFAAKFVGLDFLDFFAISPAVDVDDFIVDLSLSLV